MSQPVKLSDALVLDARLAGDIVERSIAGQVEFWARLGRSVDMLLNGQQVMKLCQNAEAKPLSACLESVSRPEGRKRLAAYLEEQPFPHYRPSASHPKLLERTDAQGFITLGRFVNREFIEAEVPRKTAKRT